jgi:hypothetical protein
MRADVGQGNIFSGVVAAAFRRVTATAVEADDVRMWVVARALRAADVPPARVNGALPRGADHEVHPVLLRALPPLTGGLEYRVLHYDLLLWDATIDFVVDVLPGAFRVETL